MKERKKGKEMKRKQGRIKQKERKEKETPEKRRIKTTQYNPSQEKWENKKNAKPATTHEIHALFFHKKERKK